MGGFQQYFTRTTFTPILSHPCCLHVASTLYLLFKPWPVLDYPQPVWLLSLSPEHSWDVQLPSCPRCHLSSPLSMAAASDGLPPLFSSRKCCLVAQIERRSFCLGLGAADLEKFMRSSRETGYFHLVVPPASGDVVLSCVLTVGFIISMSKIQQERKEGTRKQFIFSSFLSSLPPFFFLFFFLSFSFLSNST